MKKLLLALCLGLSVAWGPVAAAGEVRVPRVLLVGDSWTGFMQAYKSFDDVFSSGDYPEFANYAQVGYRTAVMGVEAERYTDPDFALRIAEELSKYPTLDVVGVTLGGNDVLGDLNPNQTPEQIQARIDEVVGYIGQVLDYILAQRADIRIALIGYSM